MAVSDEMNALIIDANCFSKGNMRSEVAIAIEGGKLIPIWSSGGQLESELKRANLNVYTIYAHKKKFFCVCDVCVQRKTAHLRSNGNLKSNDAHIVALALVSGANVLTTDDASLKYDFKDCDRIERSSNCRRRQGRRIPRKVIQSSTNSKDVNDLLSKASARYKHCPCHCDRTGC